VNQAQKSHKIMIAFFNFAFFVGSWALHYYTELSVGVPLRAGDELRNCFNQRLVVQSSDGDAVLLDEASRTLWSSG
jgi:hypothetical protein